MRFQAEPAIISIRPQGRDLTFPVDVSCAHWTPYRLVAFHVAVLNVNVYDTALRDEIVSAREGLLAGDERVRRIPH